jgi:hypothetical protein
MRRLAMTVLGLVAAACGQSEAGTHGAGGSSQAPGGAGAGGLARSSGGAKSDAAGGNPAASGRGATSASGAGDGAALGGGAGTGGDLSGQGSAPSGGEAGADSHEAGAPAVGGQAGATGEGGEGGVLAVGQYDLDLQVTYGDRSAHFTRCQARAGQLTMVEYDNGDRGLNVTCVPDTAATLQVDLVAFAFESGAIGQHEASELHSTCDPMDAHCDAVLISVSFEPIIGQGVWVDSGHASVMTGAFTLDQLTLDGRVAGSVDLTMAESGYEVTVTGRFAAHVNDCGPLATAGGCLGPHN